MSDYDIANQLWNDKGSIVCMQFYPIASVDWINLVGCLLAETLHKRGSYKQFYQCCTGQPVGCYPVYRICCQFLIDNILFSFKALLTYIACQLYTGQLFLRLLLERKILDKIILANLLKFAKFTKIFSLKNFASYNMASWQSSIWIVDHKELSIFSIIMICDLLSAAHNRKKYQLMMGIMIHKASEQLEHAMVDIRTYVFHFAQHYRCSFPKEYVHVPRIQQ